MADGTAGESRAERLARLQAEAEAAEREADAALTPDEAEEAALADRIRKANERREAGLLLKRRAVMGQRVEALRKAANGAYVVEPFDMEAETPGAGLYVLRSPSKEAWSRFQDAVAAASDDKTKVDTAYNNLAVACILWQDAPEGTEPWIAHRAKYVTLVQAIGDAASRLGGAADRARKR